MLKTIKYERPLAQTQVLALCFVAVANKWCDQFDGLWGRHFTLKEQAVSAIADAAAVEATSPSSAAPSPDPAPAPPAKGKGKLAVVTAAPPPIAKAAAMADARTTYSALMSTRVNLMHASGRLLTNAAYRYIC